MGKSIPTFILHGLMEPLSFVQPIKTYLNNKGFSTVHIVSYPSRLPLIEIISHVTDYIEHKVSDQPVNIIGHSMGGVIACNLQTIKIKKCIMITSPLKGSHIIEMYNTYLGKMLTKLLVGDMGSKLHTFYVDKDKLPFSYLTIGTGRENQHDGLVKTDDMIIDIDNHVWIKGKNHINILWCKDTWEAIENGLMESEMNIKE